MRSRKTLTPPRLRALFHYDPDTGVFTRRVRTANSTKMGEEAGSLTGGYRLISVDNNIYRAHQLAWLYIYGQWPRFNLDHINGIGEDNRITNLREATFSQNNANARIRKDNIPRLKGASWHAVSGRWRATIIKDRKQISLGLYKTPEQAHEAYYRAAKELFGEFARAE